jgi:hypothetical protein
MLARRSARGKKMISIPLNKSLNEHVRNRIIEHFPEIKSSSHIHYLSLDKYINHSPEKYYDHDKYRSILDWIEKRSKIDSTTLKEYFITESSNISKAFLNLRQINNMDIHDDKIKAVDDYELLKSIDEIINPVYLRLVEAVFSNLLKPVAYFSRVDRNKSTERLDVYNIVEEIKGTQYDEFVSSYSNTMRNGIAHGGITYLNNEIEYKDKGNAEVLYTADVIKRFDNLIDICNCMALAFKIFLLLHKNEDYILPHELLVEEIISGMQSPWLAIEACIETKIPNAKQLLIYARPYTTDKQQILYLSFCTAVLAEFLAPGFDRYFISLKSKICSSSLVIFNGNKLKLLREAKSEKIEDYRDVMESPGFFFNPIRKLPKILYKVNRISKLIKMIVSVSKAILRNAFVKVDIYTKNSKMHRNSWGMVVSGDIFIENIRENSIEGYIHNNYKMLVRRVFVTCKKQKSILSIERYLPLGYAQINLFSKQIRKRSAANYGLGKELIGTIQLKYIRRIKVPDIYESRIEQIGKYRIAWNKNWLTTVSTL